MVGEEETQTQRQRGTENGEVTCQELGGGGGYLRKASEYALKPEIRA